MSSVDQAPPLLRNRTLLVTLAVIAFHVVALWLLQTGLLRRAVDLVVPAEVIAEFIEPPRPKDEPPPPPPAEPKPRQPIALAAAPQPRAISDPQPAANAPLGVVDPPAPLPAITAPVAALPPAPAVPAAPPPAPPAPPRIELPSSDADYLQNPKPPYPAVSKRLNEQGTVIMRVLIGADGLPQKAEIKASSGFVRLDESAAATVMKWRYVPGKRAGIAEAMWFNVPINFVLE